MMADTKHSSQDKLHMYTTIIMCTNKLIYKSYTPLSNPPTLMLFY